MPPKKKAVAPRSPAPKRKVVRDSVKTAPVEPEDWKKKTVAQLKIELESRGLSTAGKKDELVRRLEEEENGDLETEPLPKLLKQASVETKKAKTAFDKLRKEAKGAKKASKPDTFCTLAGEIEVFEDYDCMLNQTNISSNNNKFYLIQLLKQDKKKGVYLWTRWGRVGEPGANELKGPFSNSEDAVEAFHKKFKDKTKNNWDERDSFKAYKGKYTLLEMGDETDEPDNVLAIPRKVEGGKALNTLKCTLDPATQYLIGLIFNDDTFTNAMEKFDLDIKKMPLGNLSKTQIAKGFDALLALENAVNENQSQEQLATLSSKFYTLIPHSFGRSRPPIIDNMAVIRVKKDMLIVLSDIELAQTMQKEHKSAEVAVDAKPHPLDEQYDMLDCKLTLLKPSEKEYKVIENYIKQTGRVKPLYIWRADRALEGKPFKSHDAIENRRLLWHGTNIAVVAAILKTGLRIMPHSGGRVGKGLYFASENDKSAGYVGTTNKYEGVMFLNEVVLGNEHHITKDRGDLKEAPKGFHSVVALGTQEPDPAKDITLDFEGKKVKIPQGKPISRGTDFQSNFYQSEYLIYKENQVRIRYVLLLSFK